MCLLPPHAGTDAAFPPHPTQHPPCAWGTGLGPQGISGIPQKGKDGTFSFAGKPSQQDLGQRRPRQMGASYIKQVQLAAGHCEPAALSQVRGMEDCFPSFPPFTRSCGASGEQVPCWEAGLKEMLPEMPAQKKSSGCSPRGLNISPIFLPFSRLCFFPPLPPSDSHRFPDALC